MGHVAEMVSVAGLGAHDGITTHRLLDHYGITLTTTIDLRHEDIRASAPPDSVEQVFQAVHLAMAADRVDEYSAAVTYAHQGDDDKLVRATLPPRLIADLGIGGDIKPSAAHALELYRQRFGNAGDFTFEVSGPIELARMKDLVVTYFGSLPDDGRREAVAPLQTLHEKRELSVKTDPKTSCSFEMHWTSATRSVSDLIYEARLWSTIVDEFAGLAGGASATQRDDLGVAVEIRSYYDCDDKAHLDEATLRERLAQLAARTFTDKEVRRVREAYAFPQPSAGPDVVRESQVITAGDMARVIANFQPPKEVLVVRQVR